MKEKLSGTDTARPGSRSFICAIAAMVVALIPANASVADQEKQSAAPQVAIREDAVNSLSQVIPSSPGITAAGQMAAGSSRFTVVNVGVAVEDEAGQPVPQALVTAYSEDWGVRYPFGRATFYTADKEGRVALRIPFGKWTFFAGGGDAYGWNRPGRGLFLTKLVTIDQSMSVTLRPDSSTTFSLKDVKGSPLDAEEVYAMESMHIPTAPFIPVGHMQDGRMLLDVNTGTQYDLMLIRRPGTEPGYFLRYPNCAVGGNLEFRTAAADLALVHLRAYDAQKKLTTLNVGVSVAWLDMNRQDGFFDFDTRGQAELYVTPQLTRLGYRNLSTEKWYYLFVGKYFDLHAGTEITYEMGGPVSASTRVLGKSDETQVYVIVRDAFDNQLDFFSNASGEPAIPITILQDNNVIASGTLGRSINGRISRGWTRTNSPRYQIDLDLGPSYGRFLLQGTLLSDETAWGWETTSSAHFTLFTPYGYSTQTSALSLELEAAYERLLDFLGEDLSRWISAYTEPAPTSAGWGGTFIMQVYAGGFFWHNEAWPSMSFENVAWHELGHVFQFSPPLSHGVECPWFCEPWATYMGYEVTELLKGEKIANWLRSSHADFFKYIDGGDAGEGERVQFILFYLRKTYGRSIHREFVHWWSDKNYPQVLQALKSAGFDTRQIVTVLYSHLSQENLGWLFRLGGVDITDDQVQKGTDIVRSLIAGAVN